MEEAREREREREARSSFLELLRGVILEMPLRGLAFVPLADASNFIYFKCARHFLLRSPLSFYVMTSGKERNREWPSRWEQLPFKVKIARCEIVYRFPTEIIIRQ
jgi:hypothetical protein